ncbi:MAG TPA: hypothetical protein VF731_01100 [Solirubrobacterales bacterium]
MLIWIAPIAGAAAFMMAAYAFTNNHELRAALWWGVTASVVLAYVSLILSLCGLAENRSMVYRARCEGQTDLLPLIGIPILIGLPFFAVRGNWAVCLLIGIAVTATAIAIPWWLLAGA